MKVLFLTEYFPIGREPIFTGGVESRVWHLTEYLKKQGHQVEVKYRTNRYQFNTPYAAVSRVWYFFSCHAQLIFWRKHFDIVEGTNFTTHILAFIWAKRIGAKAIAWYPDVFSGRGVSLLGVINGLLVELAERAALALPWDGVIALSQETKKKLKTRRVDAKRIKVIYGGVSSLPAFSKPPNPASALAILCIARLVTYKRIDDILLAIYLLKQRNINISAIIVGSGPQQYYLNKLVIQLGISENIIWKSRVSETEKFKLLNTSFIHVLPSVVEGFGLVTIESLAAGTPVVNANTAINREILQGSQGALLYPPGDYVRLAQSVATLLSSKRLYKIKSEEGKLLAKSYSWENVNSQTEKFYQSLI